MTAAKKLKKAARERAKKTGESYATARRHVEAKLKKQRGERTQKAAATAREAKAKGTVSEARCIEKTGHGFDHWFGVLDTFGAVKKGHTAAARHLREAHGVSAWYCQAITVSYERARGVRELNQLCSGNYQVSVSRVLPASFEDAAAALTHKRGRARWKDGAGSLGASVSATLDGKRWSKKPGATWARFEASGGRVELSLTAKEDGRAQVRATIEKLPDKAALEGARSAWRQLLDAVKASLAE